MDRPALADRRTIVRAPALRVHGSGRGTLLGARADVRSVARRAEPRRRAFRRARVVQGVAAPPRGIRTTIADSLESRHAFMSCPAALVSAPAGHRVLGAASSTGAARASARTSSASLSGSSTRSSRRADPAPAAARPPWLDADSGETPAGAALRCLDGARHPTLSPDPVALLAAQRRGVSFLVGRRGGHQGLRFGRAVASVPGSLRQGYSPRALSWEAFTRR